MLADKQVAALLVAFPLTLFAAASDSVFVVNSTNMPTAQRLRAEGRIVSFSSHPLDLALSKSGKLAIKSSHGLLFVDARSGRVEQNLPLPHDLVDYQKNLGGNGLVGIAWSLGEKTVWAADGFGVLRSATRGPSGGYEWDRPIALAGPSGHFRNPRTHDLDPSVPTGIALSGDGRQLFVARSRNNDVAVVDVSRRSVVASIPAGSSPFALLRRGRYLYVTNLGGSRPRNGELTADSGGDRIRVDNRGIAMPGSVSVIDVRQRRAVREVPTGRHPEAMALSSDASRLYVLNANDDTITVLDPVRDAVLATVPLPLQHGFGADPGAVAVSSVDGRLFIAEGGDNRVLVLDPQSYRAVRQIDTGWYPDGVALSSEGTVYVTSLNGSGSRGKAGALPGHVGFNVYDYTGMLQILPRGVPGEAPAESSAAFGAPAAAPDAAYVQAGSVPVPIRPGQASVFEHVVFIIKENHTYDDYFGDVADGNGDPRLCPFPERVSPNHHALARQFGLFDNFYVNGTMSADGHQWTDEGGITDYVERNTASWAKTYPSDGTDPLAYLSSGFLWQSVLDSGRSFRDYGEFVVSEPATSPENATWRQFYDDRLHGTHTVSFKNSVALRSLKPYVDMAYPGFTLRISDQARADEFIRELRGFDRSGTLPSFVLVQLGDDHTAGTFPGYPAPTSAVADNDLALGRIVSAVSHSRFWTKTIVFVVEDDAQDGRDHVDGHRTTALVISAYNKKHVVDSAYYNQTSILRTIESIFRLRPLTQFDALSPVIADLFDVRPIQALYDAVPNRVPLDALNPKSVGLTRGRRAMLTLQAKDFDRADAIDPALLRPQPAAQRMP